MDESSVSFHTRTTKKQSKEWTPKGQAGPIKAKVHASRTSQMVLAFFDNQGPIYTNYLPRGTTVNAIYILGALGSFQKVFKQKRPERRRGSGISTGIIPLFIPPPLSEIGSPPTTTR